MLPLVRSRSPEEESNAMLNIGIFSVIVRSTVMFRPSITVIVFCPAA
jgi:hypothetical protein